MVRESAKVTKTIITEHVEGFFDEFWKFVAKGNAVQLAVAIVIGNAFGAIVNSLVNDIISPFLSLATNNADFAEWRYTLRPPVILQGMSATTTPLVVNYGHLIQVTLDFFIIALSIFGVYKIFSGVTKRLQKQEEITPPTPVSTEEKLLSEIRDLLKERSEVNK